MTTLKEFRQSPHNLLVIPGPIEIADDVLFANAHHSMSHVSPEFISVFGDCIRMTRELLFAPNSQPFLIAGSGTLGWDQVAANLVEPGEHALVVHSGYFGDSFADCLETYGAKVDQIKAEIGTAVALGEIEKALKAKQYKILTFTHVDTSTSTLTDAKGIAELAKRVSPDTLVISDSVCSVASEEIRMESWGIDVVLTGSQKGIGAPPGLCILAASQKAMKVAETRKSAVTSYYASWKKWLPIMNAYESGKPAYFATPPVNLIYALHAALTRIVKGSPSLEERFELHKQAKNRIRGAAKELGLRLLTQESAASNSLTAIYLPDGVAQANLLPKLGKRGVIIAGGLHKDIRDKYFRIGHMGITVVDAERGDIDKVITAFKEAVEEARSSN